MDYRIFLLTFSALAFGTGAYVFTGFLEPMAEELGQSVGAVGQLQTIFVVSAALAGPPLAHLTRVMDRRHILLIALGCVALFSLLAGLVNSFSTLMLLRALSGVAGGLVMPAATAAATSFAAPEKRGSAIAMVIGGMTLAFLLGIPIGSLVGGLFGWRATFYFAGLIALLAFLAVALLLRPIPAAPVPEGERPDWGTILPLVSCTLVSFTATMTLVSYIGPVLKLSAGVEGGAVAAYQTFIGVGAVLALFVGGKLANLGAGRSVVIGIMLLVCCALGLHWLEMLGGAPVGWPTRIVVTFAIMLNAFALFSLMPIVQSRLITAAGPSAAPVALAINGSANYLGQGLGAAHGGLVISQLSLTATAPAGMLVALAGVLVAVWAFREA